MSPVTCLALQLTNLLSVSGCPQRLTPQASPLPIPLPLLCLPGAQSRCLCPCLPVSLSLCVSGSPRPFGSDSVSSLFVPLQLSSSVCLSLSLFLTLWELLCLSHLSLRLCLSFGISVLEILSLVSVWLTVSCCDLSLLCLPPPLPAPPSPHPELSLGNRKFGGSERYWEAQWLLLRDNAGVWGLGVGVGAQNPPRPPPGPGTHKGSGVGEVLFPLWASDVNPPPSRAWGEGQIQQPGQRWGLG